MAQTPTTPVRLKDIARDLNVSVMTVSKVVRNCADVGADDEAIGRLATSHLHERGCRRIAHIAGPQHAPGAGRLKGYRDTLAAAGIAVPDSFVEHAKDDATGYEAARRLLALNPRPDGIFGYNDPTAAGA